MYFIRNNVRTANLKTTATDAVLAAVTDTGPGTYHSLSLSSVDVLTCF